MELKESGFFCQLVRVKATNKGRFLKLLCATFTFTPLCIGYFTQNMCAPGKV